MVLWRVKELKNSNGYIIQDSDCDNITELENENNAKLYYYSVSNKNFRTRLEEKINGKWEYRMGSCNSKFA